MMMSNQSWDQAVEGKTLLIPMHSLNASSELRPGRMLELVEAARARLPIAFAVVNDNLSLTFTKKHGSPVSRIVRTGFAAFGKRLEPYQ